MLIQVTFFQRKPRPFGNYSIESLFKDVRARLATKIESTVQIAPFISNGLLRRVIIAMFAFLRRGAINHVTGDINFVTLALPPRRTILTILDCGDIERLKGFRGWLKRSLWFTWPAVYARNITTISNSSKNDILRLTRCDPKKIHVIPVAISPRFKPCQRDFYEAYPVILQIGTAYNKNIDRLVLALEGIPCKLIVVGKLTECQASAIEKAGIDCLNHARLSDEDVVVAYESCDMLCFASLAEGFGMPILEAQTVGRPVLTSNCSSMPEVAGSGACFVDPLNVSSIRSGLLKIINDRDYRKYLVEEGAKNIERFDAQMIADKYLDLYRSIHASLEKPIRLFL